jgi:DNA (cytosine-5)-methyltransferase 1
MSTHGKQTDKQTEGEGLDIKLLDLFCGAGGAAKGYHRAGFEDITGIDNKQQSRYPYKFIQADALEYLAEYGHMYDFFHASPPCLFATKATQQWRAMGYQYKNYIPETRKLIKTFNKHYVIENVKEAAPWMIDPVWLNGLMFGLQTVRTRLFECSFPVDFILSPPTKSIKYAKMGRIAKDGEYHHIAGKGGHRGLKKQWEEAMGIDWMTVSELGKALPPVYTKHIGEKFIEMVKNEPRR